MFYPSRLDSHTEDSYTELDEDLIIGSGTIIVEELLNEK
jgi:hypothetical protein